MMPRKLPDFWLSAHAHSKVGHGLKYMPTEPTMVFYPGQSQVTYIALQSQKVGFVTVG